MNNIRRFLKAHGVVIATAITLVGVVCLLFLYGIGSFLPGLSPAESQTISQSQSPQLLLKNPLWLPYKLLHLLFHFTPLAPTNQRAVSAIFASLAIAAFYYLCSKWYKPRTAMLSTCLFSVNSMTLLLGRTGTPAIMLYTWLYVAALGLWLRYSKQTFLAPLIFMLIMALALYVPGTLWFVGLLAIWFWRDIPLFFKRSNNQAVIAGGVLATLMVLPLVYAFYINSSLIYDWLLLPKSLNLDAMYTTLRSIPGAFFYKTTIPAAYNVGHLPLFDAFSGTMLLLGLYAYRKKLRLERSIFYIVAALASICLSVINNNNYTC